MIKISRLKVPCYALQGLKYSEISKPNKTLNTKLIVNLITPTKTYREKLKLKNIYDDKIKG